MRVMPIAQVIKETLKHVFEVLNISISRDVPLEHPTDLQNGDYSSGVALRYAKQIGTAPRALAEEIANLLRS